ncbi:Ser/Thr protein phosphatase family protein [Bifidobacterium dolichotidis]|uniref:Ser/Thr protein phosphatase family protein n=1 Tax=Bifidobacterium dolichotidis TaxID=2306976 RepID=A0A430FQ27_9BIFI|nr:metallophosphoesterase [Bifidobacterium dolichotidis]RSX54931.1 Ser/Thr protein phosphatase family protein [Bifidobacterium dolichotidis]
MTKPLRFRKDGTFRVLQLADIQDGPAVSPDTIALIDAAIERAEPDLVVLTGDQIRGYDPAFAEYYQNRQGDEPGTPQPFGSYIERALTHGDVRTQWWRRVQDDIEQDPQAAHERARQKVEACVGSFLEPIVRRGIPFAVTYGNHDFQCGISLEEQDKIYQSFEGCMNPVDRASEAQPMMPSLRNEASRKSRRKTRRQQVIALRNAARSLTRRVNSRVSQGLQRIAGQTSTDQNPLSCEPGTFALPIQSSDGTHAAMAVVLVNSGDYEPGGGYGAPSPTAIRWLTRVMNVMSANRVGKMPAIAFQHIPAPEIYDCLKPVSRFTVNGIRGYRKFSDRVFVVDKRRCRPQSTMNERPCCAENNVGEVQAMRNAGGYFALYAGHDHSNTFIGDIGNFELGYTPTAGFTSYGPKSSDRALRLFVFNEHHPAQYETRLLKYGDLIGRLPMKPVRVLLGETMVADVSSIGNWLRNAKVRAVLGAVATYMVASKFIRYLGSKRS